MRRRVTSLLLFVGGYLAMASLAPLVAVGFFDRYQGKGVPDAKVSVSVRLTFQAPDRTRGAIRRDVPKPKQVIEKLVEGTGGLTFPIDQPRDAAPRPCGRT